MTCCDNPQIKDLSQGLGPERHYYCSNCKAHEYKGCFYTERTWAKWFIDEENKDQYDLFQPQKTT